jgi:hypothetical protein
MIKYHGANTAHQKKIQSEKSSKFVFDNSKAPNSLRPTDVKPTVTDLKFSEVNNKSNEI